LTANLEFAEQAFKDKFGPLNIFLQIRNPKILYFPLFSDGVQIFNFAGFKALFFFDIIIL
jgi:hypothetical protein